LEQLDDVLDGVAGLMEGRFEIAFWPWRCSGLMMKERSAELLVEENEQKRDLGSFLCYTGSRIAVPRSHAAEWHFHQENGTFHQTQEGT
jgi:hypothetical protein